MAFTSTVPASPENEAVSPSERDARLRGSAPPLLGAEEFSVGYVLGGTYEIRGVLGRGGMGQVYDGWDIALNRRVAIKTSLPGLPSIENEARALAALRHPSLVTVHALGDHEGTPFMVMEHVPGVTLAAHLEKRRMSGSTTSVEETLDLLVAIAEGLAAVHRAGLAHRDLTPANVILAPGNRVVLTDFGLVQAEFAAGRRKSGAFGGTPAYMAPESFSNDLAPGDVHLVDVYALGVIAFEMLTTRLPYEASTIPALSILHGSAAIPEPLGPEPIPTRLAALVRELMAKEPAARPALESVVWQLRAIRNDVLRRGGDAPLTVLVVDDDRYTAQLLAMYVKHSAPEAEVAVANNAKQALEFVRKKPPHIMVLDLIMPEMGGIELFMYLRGERIAAQCNIVAVSVDADPGDVELLYELGVAHFLPKDNALQERLKAFVREYVRCLETGEPLRARAARKSFTSETG